MRMELLYNPRLLVERLAIASQSRRRLQKLKHTVAQHLKAGEIDSLELLELLEPTPPTVIYDIGAHEGTWTLLAKAKFPAAEVHAFEPLNSHILKFTSVTRQLASVYLHPIALGTSKAQQPMQIATLSDASSLLEIGPQMEKSFHIHKASEEAVTVERMDDYVADKKLKPPDLIKLDVQGYELEILRAGLNCLCQARAVIIEVLFIELYPKQCFFADIVKFMMENNFHLHAFANGTALGKPLKYTDALFIRDQ